MLCLVGTDADTLRVTDMTAPTISCTTMPVRKGRVLLWCLITLIAFDYLVLAFDSTWKRYSPDD